LQGKVWKFGDNIDTDLIIAARYLNTSEASELAKHVMEDADPMFISKMSEEILLLLEKTLAVVQVENMLL